MMKQYKVAHAVFALSLSLAISHAAFAESTNRSPYNSRAVVEYDEISDFVVKSFPLRMAHPYEIQVPNTTIGQVIACRINANGEELSSNLSQTPGLAALFEETPESVTINSHRTGRDMQFVDSGNGTTSVFFSQKIPDAVFRCFNVSIEFQGQ
ncbi:hypothetical protein BC777_2616 [Yoonia maricola]|uniref:Uncharacterized protein n=1 Tax=Yoonia maricola TaxID=420999 RepID=A0A2M8W5Q9_9RHOB|nr:hypothetical protein [Yoonia maricola]PJI86248.1 hypothetical protein BC777_2616 [Yoonia maricola]